MSVTATSAAVWETVYGSLLCCFSHILDDYRIRIDRQLKDRAVTTYHHLYKGAGYVSDVGRTSLCQPVARPSQEQCEVSTVERNRVVSGSALPVCDKQRVSVCLLHAHRVNLPLTPTHASGATALILACAALEIPDGPRQRS